MRSLSPHTNRSSFISQPFVHSNKICQPFGRIGLFEECNLCKNIENLRRFMQFYLISSQRNKNCEFSSFHVTIAIISSSSSNPFITSQVAIESMRRKMLNWLRAMNKFVIFHSKKRIFFIAFFHLNIELNFPYFSILLSRQWGASRIWKMHIWRKMILKNCFVEIFISCNFFCRNLMEIHVQHFRRKNHMTWENIEKIFWR